MRRRADGASRRIDYSLTLPLPKSANRRLIRARGGRQLILSQAYRVCMHELIAAVEAQRVGQPTITGRAGLLVVAHFPDHRRRDIDNIVKPLLDSFTRAGVWEDDMQVDALTVTRGEVARPGRVLVRVWEIEPSARKAGRGEEPADCASFPHPSACDAKGTRIDDARFA